MNKYQEALDFFVKFACEEKCEDCDINNHCDFQANIDKHYKNFRQLVDRATSKKVKYDKSPHGNGYMYSCPVCGRMFGVNCKPSYMNFCDDCGQAIDWSEKE